MKKSRKKRYRSVLVIFVASLLFLCGCKEKPLENRLEKQTEKTAAYIKKAVPSPQVSAVGGEWAIKGLAESGVSVERAYWDSYYDTVRATVKASQGNLHESYYSDYARVIIGLDAIGKDASSIEGYDLTKALDAYETLTEQGANAVAYTIVAIHVAGIKCVYEPEYVSFLLSETKHLIKEKKAENRDYLAMCLLGLSFYQENIEVKQVTEQGIAYLSEQQETDGTMGSCETTAETIVALTQLEVDVYSDERFLKNGNSLGESLMRYACKNGAFSHTEEEKTENEFASEKALLALCSMKKQEKGAHLYESKK